VFSASFGDSKSLIVFYGQRHREASQGRVSFELTAQKLHIDGITRTNHRGKKKTRGGESEKEEGNKNLRCKKRQ
jgi:hypothetical protein